MESLKVVDLCQALHDRNWMSYLSFIMSFVRSTLIIITQVHSKVFINISSSVLFRYTLPASFKSQLTNQFVD
jgi:hypothetical protein